MARKTLITSHLSLSCLGNGLITSWQAGSDVLSRHLFSLFTLFTDEKPCGSIRTRPTQVVTFSFHCRVNGGTKRGETSTSYGAGESGMTGTPGLVPCGKVWSTLLRILPTWSTFAMCFRKTYDLISFSSHNFH